MPQKVFRCVRRIKLYRFPWTMIHRFLSFFIFQLLHKLIDFVYKMNLKTSVDVSGEPNYIDSLISEPVGFINCHICWPVSYVSLISIWPPVRLRNLLFSKKENLLFSRYEYLAYKSCLGMHLCAFGASNYIDLVHQSDTVSEFWWFFCIFNVL